MGDENPFRKFFAERGIEGSGEIDSNGEATSTPPDSEPVEEVVLAFEKRAAGKVVTTVRDIPQVHREEYLRSIRKAFGCGGSIVGDLLLIQGDHRGPLTRWFEKRGVRVRGERG